MTQIEDDDFRAHYDASQFRLEAWSELKHLAARLDRASARNSSLTAPLAKVQSALAILKEIEWYYCFPGDRAVEDLERALENGIYRGLSRQVARLTRMLVSESYRGRDVTEIFGQDDDEGDREADRSDSLENAPSEARPYFEVLLVDDMSRDQEIELRRRMLAMRRPEDQFIYDVVVVNSAEDALIAVQCNNNIQTCVLRYSFPLESRVTLPELRDDLVAVDTSALTIATDRNRAPALGRAIKSLRPELDLFLNTDEPVEHVAGEIDSDFRRVFYGQEDFLELHLSILKGIGERFETPFFSALKQHSQKPTGMFHALPISRGKSITRSHWIRDMARFYGTNIFMAETSATSGGLDSLLQPHGPIKRSQELEEKIEHQSPREQRIHQERVANLTERLPPLPNFSHFHRAFRPFPDSSTPEGDLREAYFLAYDEHAFEYLTIDGTLPKVMASAREVVSASFVTPYPPGFPVLVPGQVISEEILSYMRALDVKEIHGYRPDYGFRVFTEAALRGIEKKRGLLPAALPTNAPTTASAPATNGSPSSPQAIAQKAGPSQARPPVKSKSRSMPASKA